MNMNMNYTENKIDHVITNLLQDSKYDYLKMMKGVFKNITQPIGPVHFADAYLSISKEQGEDIMNIIIKNGFQHIVEFGTSFGISTLFLAKAAKVTDGNIITTELIESKATKAQENFTNAGVDDIIEIRVGDALNTLADLHSPIDFLFLDGWKDLYHPLFNMLKKNFLDNINIYVDNADMTDSKRFLDIIAQDANYNTIPMHNGKAALIYKCS